MVIMVHDGANVGRITAKVVVRDDAGTARTIKRVSIRDQFSAPHVVWSSLTATVSADSVSGATYSHAATPATTEAVGASPVGGTGPYTYSWVQTGGDGGWSAINPTNAATAFRSPGLLPGDYTTATFACSVTDSAGATATTPTVFASAANNNPYA